MDRLAGKICAPWLKNKVRSPSRHPGRSSPSESPRHRACRPVGGRAGRTEAGSAGRTVTWFSEDHVLAVLPVPDHVELLVVLGEQSVREHVVAVYDHGRVGPIAGPADPGAMIGAPRPDVVEDRVVGVDDPAVGRLSGSAPPTRRKPTCTSVGSSVRSACQGLWPRLAPRRRRRQVQRPASKIIPDSLIPGTSAVCIDTFPSCRDRRRKPSPSTTVSEPYVPGSNRIA